MIKGFTSYCHADEALRMQMDIHLSILKRQGLVDLWYDRRIVAGSDLEDAITNNLEKASIILLLISPDFIASDYCFSKEMAWAMERHEQGTARVIPVILRPCDWIHPPLSRLLAVPRDGKAVTTWTNIDEAFTDVTKQVRRAIEELGTKADHANVQSPVKQAVTELQEIALPNQNSSLLRSKNVRLKKEFTDYDRDEYLHDSFELMAQFFKDSSHALEQSEPDVKTRFKRIDATQFTAVIYRNGKVLADCTVRIDSSFGQTSHIAFAYGAQAPMNTSNETLYVENDDQKLFFKPLGMYWRSHAMPKILAPQEAADYLWDMLIQQAQR